MKVLWTLFKVALALVLVIPLGIIVLATMLGIFGALLGLAIMALRVAVVGLVIYGAQQQDLSPYFKIREENVYRKVKNRMKEWLGEIF